MEGNSPSTGTCHHRGRMPDFDDPLAYIRRWARQSDTEVSRLADEQPLLFLADHVALADRREGTVAIHARLDDGSPLAAIITGGPPDPSPYECVAALGMVVENTGPSRVMSMGLVHHRRGRPHLCDTDRRWRQALEDTCAFYAIAPVGVLIRTESGALLPVPTSEPG